MELKSSFKAYVNVRCGIVMSCVFCNLSKVGKSEILNYSLCCPFHRFHSSHECKVPQQQRSTCLSVRNTATLGNRRVSQESGAQDPTCRGVLVSWTQVLSLVPMNEKIPAPRVSPPTTLGNSKC